LSAVFGKA